MVNIEGMARREKPLEGGNVPLCNSSSGDHASGSEGEEETEDDDHSFSAMSNSQFFDSTDFLPHKTQQAWENKPGPAQVGAISKAQK